MEGLRVDARVQIVDAASGGFLGVRILLGYGFFQHLIVIPIDPFEEVAFLALVLRVGLRPCVHHLVDAETARHVDRKLVRPILFLIGAAADLRDNALIDAVRPLDVGLQGIFRFAFLIGVDCPTEHVLHGDEVFGRGDEVGKFGDLDPVSVLVSLAVRGPRIEQGIGEQPDVEVVEHLGVTKKRLKVGIRLIVVLRFQNVKCRLSLLQRIAGVGDGGVFVHREIVFERAVDGAAPGVVAVYDGDARNGGKFLCRDVRGFVVFHTKVAFKHLDGVRLHLLRRIGGEHHAGVLRRGLFVAVPIEPCNGRGKVLELGDIAVRDGDLIAAHRVPAVEDLDGLLDVVWLILVDGGRVKARCRQLLGGDDALRRLIGRGEAGGCAR